MYDEELLNHCEGIHGNVAAALILFERTRCEVLRTITEQLRSC
jgi:hypothetical protein